MATMGFVDGARWCYLDFWMLSMSNMFMALFFHNDKTKLHVRWGVLRPFVSAERILKEFGLTNKHDPRVAAYNETTERILAAYPGDQVIYSDPQVVQLPLPSRLRSRTISFGVTATSFSGTSSSSVASLCNTCPSCAS